MNPLLNDFSLKSASALTTLKTGGSVWTLCPTSVRQLARYTAELAEQGVKYMPFGQGSNLVVSDKPSTVAVLMNNFDLIEVRGRRVYVGAGAKLSKATSVIAANGLSGVEFWAGIPASFGGAVKMNAGAFGGETMDKVRYLDVLSRGSVKRIYSQSIKRGYRHTDLDGIVLGGELLLDKSTPSAVADKIAENLFYRRQTQPTGLSAGSVFKKVNGVSAGKFIELAGLKGLREGGMVVSEKHANFFINDRGASTADFLKLVDKVQKKVYAAFGVMPEKEVIFVE